MRTVMHRLSFLGLVSMPGFSVAGNFALFNFGLCSVSPMCICVCVRFFELFFILYVWLKMNVVLKGLSSEIVGRCC